MSAWPAGGDDALAALRAAAGPDALITSRSELAYYEHDVFSAGAPLLAVFRPADKAALARGVAAATAQGCAVVPRGGGMSYTGGYLAAAPGAVLVDLAAMNRVLEVNTQDLTATVEAGCTWAALHAALRPLGLRARAWGTLSGTKATVGGGMSQNGVFWGARDGVLVDAAIRFEVVLADGRILSTGSAFFRPFGPDITGLFAADTGALGIKATITLQLVREGAALGFRSYVFDTAEGLFGGMSEVARAGLAAESFGFDPFLQAQRMKRESLAADARSLLNVVKKQGSVLAGLKEGTRMVAAGRSFLKDGSFSLHLICEGRSQRGIQDDLIELDRVLGAAGGHEVEATIPKVVRAHPFPPVSSMVGPTGERWVPIHGFLPHSRLLTAWERIQALYERHQQEMECLHIGAGAMFAAVSPSVCLIEPVFYWPDELQALHHRSIDPAHWAKLTLYPENLESRALVTRLRAQVIEIFRALDAAHLQVARTYPLQRALTPEAWELLKAVKAHVDPKNLMNPGSLGL